MIWITRNRPKVGRVGCAWLIRRKIDQQAEFVFAEQSQLAREAECLGATIYHVDGSGFSRKSDSASFEITARHYDLVDSDPALALLCQIVNTADIPRGPTQRPEGPGLRAIIDGLLLIEDDDYVVLERGMTVYDALYAYCADQVRRGRAS